MFAAIGCSFSKFPSNYGIDQTKLRGLIKTLPLREEFTEMMINIVQMKPDITYHQYVEHSELVQTLYT